MTQAHTSKQQGDVSTENSLRPRAVLAHTPVRTAEPAEAGGRATQGLPRAHCLWGEPWEASDQTSPPSCFLAPQWDWQDVKPISEKHYHSQKSHPPSLLPQPETLSPAPPPLHAQGTERLPLPLRPTPVELHTQAGSGQNNKNANTVS